MPTYPYKNGQLYGLATKSIVGDSTWSTRITTFNDLQESMENTLAAKGDKVGSDMGRTLLNFTVVYLDVVLLVRCSC